MYKNKYADLMSRVIDMHVHINPDTSLLSDRRRTTEDLVDEAYEGGMCGMVLKSHGWPQPNYARSLDKRHEDFHVFAAVCMNTLAGGLRPWVAEMAAQMGVKMAFYPTMTSLHEKGSPYGYIGTVAGAYNKKFESFRDDEYIYILKENGELTDDAKECLQIFQAHDMVVGSGHMSKEETFALAKYAQEIGFDKLTITHPYADIGAYTQDELVELSKMGCYIEILLLNILPLFTSTTMQAYKELIEAVGPEHCFFGTDTFFDWQPSQPSQFNLAFEGLEILGLSRDALATMVEVPHKLLGVD